MTGPNDPADFVRAAGATVGVRVAPEDAAAVSAVFAGLARAAAALFAFPLPEEIEPAAVFTPLPPSSSASDRRE